MTVQELINELEKSDDKNKEVFIFVGDNDSTEFDRLLGTRGVDRALTDRVDINSKQVS